MNKETLSAIAAVLCLFAFQGTVYAAEPEPGEASPQKQQEPAPDASTGQSTQGEFTAQKKEEFFAEMEKCDALQSVAEKQQCVDAIRKRFGQM